MTKKADLKKKITISTTETIRDYFSAKNEQETKRIFSKLLLDAALNLIRKSPEFGFTK